MTWFRIDDGFYNHEKVIELSDSAIALWVKAGCWCAQKLTNGNVPRNMIHAFSRVAEDAAHELIDAGLWSTTARGFRFHDWDQWNPTRAQVEARRERDRERKREQRKQGHPKNVRTDSKNVTSESRRESARTPSKLQVNGGGAVRAESPLPDPDPYGSRARAREAPDGLAPPAVDREQAKRVAESRLPEIREMLTKRRNGKSGDEEK